MIVYDSTHSDDVKEVAQINRGTRVVEINIASAAAREDSYLTERIQRENRYQNRKRDTLAD